jgi:serine/threonine protein kinase
MPLSAETHLGPYEILGPIGKGGMGEVYRARDTKLKRDVALKVLPASFARDPDRMARFQREAEVLASLNHPNIAAIYGIEHREGSTRWSWNWSKAIRPKARCRSTRLGTSRCKSPQHSNMRTTRAWSTAI